MPEQHLRRAFAPRKRIVLLEPLPAVAGTEQAYRAHPARAEVIYVRGSVRLAAGGVAEAVAASVVFRIPRPAALRPDVGWFVRNLSDRGREYEVVSRASQGLARTVLALTTEYRPGRVAVA